VSRALFAGPAAFRALSERRTGVVESVLSRAAYVAFDEDWVGVADRRAPFGPLSLVVDRVPRVVPGTPARVDAGTLWLGNAPVSIERLRPRASWPLAWTAALGRLPAPPRLLQPGLAALTAGDTARAVPLLAGLGPGLTPMGDDVLAGYAAGTGAQLSRSAAGRCSPLGLAYLRAAERGELPDACARLAFRDWGASSGQAFGWGLAAARSASAR
jgi:hypothetical protein